MGRIDHIGLQKLLPQLQYLIQRKIKHDAIFVNFIKLLFDWPRSRYSWITINGCVERPSPRHYYECYIKVTMQLKGMRTDGDVSKTLHRLSFNTPCSSDRRAAHTSLCDYKLK